MTETRLSFGIACLIGFLGSGRQYESRVSLLSYPRKYFNRDASRRPCLIPTISLGITVSAFPVDKVQAETVTTATKHRLTIDGGFQGMTWTCRYRYVYRHQQPDDGRYRLRHPFTPQESTIDYPVLEDLTNLPHFPYFPG